MIFYLSKTIENSVNLFCDLRIGSHIPCQRKQVRIFGCFILVAMQESDYAVDGLQRPAQLKQSSRVDPGAINPYTSQHRTHIVEMIGRKGVLLLNDMDKLLRL